MTKPHTRRFIAAAAALAILAAPVVADARAGRGGSFGSRGGNTFSAPPATSTAPRTAAPMERSATPTPGVQRPGSTAASPAAPARPGFFGGRGGFFGGLMGGLLGAGLIGMLLGHGFLGGMAGFASILGLLLQVALIVILARLAFRWWQRRQQPAFAGAAGPMQREAMDWTPRASGGGTGAAAAGLGAAPAYDTRQRERRDELGIGQSDYAAFEQILVGVQDAYGRQDAQALRMMATPEMTGYFAEEFDENARRGVVNHVADVRLLQGDLAESWRERDAEYATVALRFALRDWTVDQASGRVVDGDPDRETEAVEVWTFRRVPRGPWLLSAIQQA